LIFPTNLARLYYHKYFVHGIMKISNCLQDFISEYGKRNLYDDKKQNQIYNKLLEKHPFENSQNLPININIDVACVGSQIGLVDPNYWIHDVGDSLENKILLHEQMHIFNIICSKTNGLHVILGTWLILFYFISNIKITTIQKLCIFLLHVWKIYYGN